MKQALTGLLALLALPLFSQSFTTLPGPLGTVRALLRGADNRLYLGSTTKGVYTSTDDGQSWTGLGGNTIQVGRINALCFDTAGQLVAATEQGGVKRWDGTAWVNLGTGLPTGCGLSVPVRALAVDADGALYAGLHRYGACFPTGGLYRLDGMAWTAASAGLLNLDITSLTTDPVSATLYAGTDGGGVYRLDSAGWTPLNAGLSDLSIQSLAFSPDGTFLYAGTDSGIARWDLDAGTGWTLLNNGLPGAPVRTIAVDPANPQHLVAGTGYWDHQVGSLYGRLFGSSDGGAQWTELAPTLETTAINALLFAGNGDQIAAGWGVFRSADGGANWTASYSGFSGRSFISAGQLAVMPAPNHALFYATVDGVFKSTDEGASWTLANRGLSRHLVTLLKADRAGNLFCGVMRYLAEAGTGFGDGVLYKSTDQGETWAAVTIAPDWRYLEIAELPGGDLICSHGFGSQPPQATLVGSSLAISHDQGDTWIDLNCQSGLGYCCAASADSVLFIAGESAGVWRSMDGGQHFALAPVPGQSGNVTTLEVSPSGELLLVSGGPRTLRFSNDDGLSWENFLSPVLPDYRGVSDVTFDDAGKAYCTTVGQGGAPSLFTIEPPFTANSTFIPAPGLVGSYFKMTWDECGYLYLYAAGQIARSETALKAPGPDCLSTLADAPTRNGTTTLFPNPVAGTLNVRTGFANGFTAEVIGASGRRITSAASTAWLELDVSGLPCGIYFVKIFEKNSISGPQFYSFIKI